MASFNPGDEVVLRVIGGPNHDTRIQVPEQGLELGRGVDGPGGLYGDQLMSGRHAELWWDAAGGLHLEDLQSRNGTLLNGKPITGTPAVEPGDEIKIGETTLVVLVSRGQPGAAATAPTPPPPEPAKRVEQRATGHGVNVEGGNYGIVDARQEKIRIKVDDPASRFARMRGPAKLVLIVGLLVAFAGFAAFGYPIIASAGDFAQNDQAQNDCLTRYPELGAEQNTCIIEAGQKGIFGAPDRSQWTTIGAGLFFVGLVLTTFAYFLPGANPEKKKRTDT